MTAAEAKEPPILPARGIISLKLCPDEGCRAILIGCDCATTTHLTVDSGGAPFEDDQELAFTCDGCHSVTWFTVRVECGGQGWR